MKLDKAIEILDSCVSETENILWPESLEAHKLGIAALRRRQYQSEQTSKWADIRLPGETEE